MKDWDSLYKTEKNPFGVEPSFLITNYLHLFPKEAVLDLGSGSGRNALFLAQKGFKVSCVDVSSSAMENLTVQAKELEVGNNITTLVKDLANFDFDKKYGVIICYTTLHFLPDKDARKLIENIKNNTTAGGINIIADFAGEGPLKRDTAFWLKNDELKDLYNGWEILLYQEELSKTKAKDDSGKPFMQNMARIVAQKPV